MIKATKEFRDSITQEHLNAIRDFICAKARAKEIKKQVTEYQKQILRKLDFKIKDPENIYLLPENEFKIYLKECHKQHKKHNYNVKFGYCPSLIADSKKVMAFWHVVKLFEPITGIKRNNLYKLTHIKRYENILIMAYNSLGGIA